MCDATDDDDEPLLPYTVENIEAWANGDKLMSARQAHDFERRLGLPEGWMDEPSY
jgi:hypothetical protein